MHTYAHTHVYTIDTHAHTHTHTHTLTQLHDHSNEHVPKNPKKRPLLNEDTKEDNKPPRKVTKPNAYNVYTGDFYKSEGINNSYSSRQFVKHRILHCNQGIVYTLQTECMLCTCMKLI